MLKGITKRIARVWKKTASMPKPSYENTMQSPNEILTELLHRNVKAAGRLSAEAKGTDLWPLCVRLETGYRQLERELFYGMPEQVASQIMAGWVEWHNQIYNELTELKINRKTA